MNLHENDPKLTAYLAGELSHDEAREIEAYLQEHPELQETLDEMKSMGDMLSAAFAAEPTMNLSQLQHDSLLGRAEAVDHAAQQQAHKENLAGLSVAVKNKTYTFPGPLMLLRTRLWLTLAATLVIGMTVGIVLYATFKERTIQTERSVTLTKQDSDGSEGAVLIDISEFMSRHEKMTAKDMKKSSEIATIDSRPIIPQEGRRLGTLECRITPMSKVSYDREKKCRLKYESGWINLDGLLNQKPSEGWNREGYAAVKVNPYKAVKDHPLSTFSIDVDTASYANVRRMLLQQNQLPPAGAVRIEELVNYFEYDYTPPASKSDHPFAVHTAVASCPWNPSHRLLRVALKGKEIPRDKRPATNLVFLLDVSGSMRDANKLPMVKESMKLLINELGENDRIAIAVYAGAAGLVLPSTPCHKKETILAALDKLSAGGSTNGGAGIALAYKTAEQNFIKSGSNRVILCTDGDFNVGTTNDDALVKLIQNKAKSGVFLNVLGFGMGNYQDAKLQQLADKGNGSHGYIDSLREAKKHFVAGLSGSLVTIAKDVKIQVEFNPAEVAAYRLIGYENRLLAKEDFNDDTKDAGEIGAGHTVTALYEVVPAASSNNLLIRVKQMRMMLTEREKQLAATPTAKNLQTLKNEIAALQAGVKAIQRELAVTKPTQPAIAKVDALKYQTRPAMTQAADSGELLTVKLRYKQPNGKTSKLLQTIVKDGGLPMDKLDTDFRFAAAVAGFGMCLRNDPLKGKFSYAKAEALARSAMGKDPRGYRKEFVQMVEKAKTLYAHQSEKKVAFAGAVGPWQLVR